MTKPPAPKSRKTGPNDLKRFRKPGPRGARSAHPDGPSSLPEVVVAEVAEITEDGEALARPLEWAGQGRPPKIFLQPATGHAAMGVGDRALMRLRRLSPTVYAGTVLRRIEGQVARIVGVYTETAQGGRITPTDRRQKDEVLVPRAHKGDVKDGDLVVAEILSGAALGLPQARIVEVLGPMNSPRAVSLIAIYTHELPLAFPEEVEKEAAKCPRPTLGLRTDLRDVPLVTIDGPDARDFDDAVFAERDGDGWKILVAIADVANYVTPGSPLDREALRRGNSTYFPDRVVPMLPEALSNDLCSLRPHEDRACMAIWMWVDGDGKMTRHQVVRGLMKSRARLTYEQVQAAMDGTPDELTTPLIDPILKPLYGAYKTLLAARERRGTLELDLPERKVLLDDKGRVREVTLRERLDSHRLIEEMMILANVAAAEALQARKMDCMYRVHEPPALEKLEALREFLDPLGFSLPAGGDLKPRNFAHILQKVADQPISQLVSMIVLRSQSQARYSPENAGHFGLALTNYAHFTSPIRRYADLVVHRALIRAYGLGDGGLTDREKDRMDEIGDEISMTERRSAVAERDAIDRYLALYMEKQVGNIFTGRVNGVTRFGLFVELDGTGADGLVPLNMLVDDYYDHDDKRHCLVGRRWGRVIRLGARARVKLAAADGLSGSLTFQPLEIEADVLDTPPRSPGKRIASRGKAPKKPSAVKQQGKKAPPPRKR